MHVHACAHAMALIFFSFNISAVRSTLPGKTKTAGDEFRTAIAAADLRVEYRLKNIMASEDEMAQLLKAALIHIDINHHGDIEDAILQVCCKFFFRRAPFSVLGYLVCVQRSCRHLLASGVSCVCSRPFPRER